ncbi:hypothetical protein [Gryllotalpicola ginsengisoli]|uniref:hypothetical protein n=1 Tax=Gryllotalpicola ginsengisoli TaxID=444608 RepID=UPI0003B40398|nr:hypothetical protein [Gryllotalpicola ginsengisoli]
MKNKLAVAALAAASVTVAGALAAAPAHAADDAPTTAFGVLQSFQAGITEVDAATFANGVALLVGEDADWNVVAARVDLATGATTTVKLGAGDELFPSTIAASPDGGTSYIDLFDLSGSGTDTIETVNWAGAAPTVVKHTISVSPLDLAVSPDGQTLYVAAAFDQEIAAFSAATLGDASAHSATPAWSVGTTKLPLSVAVSPDGDRLYVGQSTFKGNSGELDSIDLTAVSGASAALSPVNSFGAGVEAVAATAQHVYAATVASGDASQSTLNVLDAADPAITDSTVTLPADVSDIVPAVDDSAVYLAGTDDDGALSVAVVDPAAGTVTKTAALGDSWYAAVGLAADGVTPYAVDGDGRISRLGDGQVLTHPTGVTVSGTVAVGSRVTAVQSGPAWTAGTTVGYQWFDDDGLIPGATGSSYVPTADEEDEDLWVEVTGQQAGYVQTALDSAPHVVAEGKLTAPKPTVSGTAKVGQTLTAIRGTWTAGTSFRYQWYASGTAIKGATGKTLTLSSTLKGKAISVHVIGTKSGYQSKEVGSTRTAPVAAGTLKTVTPTIDGTVKAGKTIEAIRGTWTSGTAYRYQWYVNGKAISGATGKTLTLKAGWAGMKVLVKVTGSKPGYTTATVASAAKTIAR